MDSQSSYLMKFLDLPHDVLLNISSYFSPTDILVLKQTCRVLHAFGCSDYVWHNLEIDIPLNLPHDNPVSSLSSAALQLIVIDALRLDHNWRKPDPRVKCIQITEDFENATIKQLRFLGNRHVLILSRWPNHDELSAWRLDVDPLDNRTTVRLTSVPMIQFAAVTRFGNYDATVVVLCSDGTVSAYSLPLDAPCSQPYTLSKAIPAPSEGRISVVEICNDMMATLVARFPEHFGPPIYTVMFYNIVSRHKFIYQFSPHMSIDRLQMKLYHACFVLTGVYKDFLVMRVHQLPSIIYTRDIDAETTVLTAEQCPLLVEHVLSPISRLCEFYLSSEPVHDRPSFFSLVLFHSWGEHVKGTVDVYKVAVDPTRRNPSSPVQNPSHKFKTTIGTRPEIVCIGKSGLRAIWLDHEWESDEYKLWRATFPPGEAARVSPLLPPHHPLPFEAHMIAALSFEEATGRICVGLRTGAVYVLEL